MTNQWFSTTGREGLIVPEKIPGAEINPDHIYDAARQLGMVAIQLPVGSKRVTTAWTSLSNVMRVSGTEPLHSALTPPMQSVVGVADNFDKVATALREFAGTCERILPQLTGIRQEAREFVSGITWDGKAWMPLREVAILCWYFAPQQLFGVLGDAPAPSTQEQIAACQGIGFPARPASAGGEIEVLASWRTSSRLVETNSDLVNRVANLVADLVDAEQRCATAINLLRSVPTAPLDVTFPRPVEDVVTAYPWGFQTVKDPSAGESLWDGAKESVTATRDSLGLAVGYNPGTGDFWDYGYTADVAVETAKSTGAGLALLVPTIGKTVSLVSPEAGDALAERGKQHWNGVFNVDGWRENPTKAFGGLVTDVGIGLAAGAVTGGAGTVAGVVGKNIRSSAASSATRISKRLSGVSTRAGALVDARIAGPLRGPGQVSFAPDTFVKAPQVDQQLGLVFDKEFPSSALTDKPEPAPSTWDEKVLEKAKEEASGVIGTGAEPTEESTPVDGEVPSHPNPVTTQHSLDVPELPASLTLGLDEARSKWRDELRESLRAAAGNPPVQDSVTAVR